MIIGVENRLHILPAKGIWQSTGTTSPFYILKPIPLEDKMQYARTMQKTLRYPCI